MSLSVDATGLDFDSCGTARSPEVTLKIPMNIKRNLTFRYALALGLVATVLLATHFIAAKRLAEAAHDGHLIDISGMQRMLSQRIALLSSELTRETDFTMRSSLSARLEAAVDQMTENHAELSADWAERASAGNTIYRKYREPGGLGKSVESFIGAARALVRDRPDVNQTQRIERQAEELASIAIDHGFLADLNAVVKRYSIESKDRASNLQRLQLVALSVGLVVLLLEALLIFRPMVHKVSWCIGVLDEANEELRTLATSLSRNLRTPIIDSIGLIKSVDIALSSGKVTEASAATKSVYASMITLDGTLDELLDVVARHRTAIVNFATLGRGKKQEDSA